MDCPACTRGLREVTAGELTVDVCDGGCGGIWFDAGELRRVDEAHEAVDPNLFYVARDPALQLDAERRRPCPRCADAILMRRFTSVDRRVQIDECPACAGVWLDAGELAEIRSEFESDEARAKAAAKHLDDAFGEWIFEEETKTGEFLIKAELVAHYTRYIRPSYYLFGT